MDSPGNAFAALKFLKSDINIQKPHFILDCSKPISFALIRGAMDDATVKGLLVFLLNTF